MHTEDVMPTLFTQESEIFENKELLQLTLDNVNDGLFEFRVDTGELFCSPRASEMLGLPSHTLPYSARELREVVHPDDRAKVRDNHIRLLHGEYSSFQLEFRVKQRNSSYRWYLARGHALHNKDKSVQRVIGWYVDIHEKKLSEEQQQRTMLYETLRADIGMIVGRKGSITEMLQQCCERLQDALDIAGVHVWLLHEEQPFLLEQAATAGVFYPRKQVHTSLDDIARFRSGRGAYLDNNLLQNALFEDKVWAQREGLRAMISYMLVVEDGVKGCLTLLSRQELLQETCEALELVANSIAQGIARKQAMEQLEEHVEQRTQELTSLLSVSQVVASRLEMQPLLRTILEQLKTIIDYDDATLLEYRETVDFGGNQFVILDHLGQQSLQQIERLKLFFEQNYAFAHVVEQRQATFLNLSIHPRFMDEMRQILQNPDDELPFHAWMGVPLIVNERAIGVLSLLHRHANQYTQRHADLAFALANQAAIALENARLYEQARDLAALQERQRLARELHDSVSQELYGISLSVQAARECLEQSPAQAEHALDYVLQHVQAGLAEMDSLLFELHPDALEREGLVAALKRLIEVLSSRGKLHVEAHIEGEPDLSGEERHTLYRIAQEATNNIIKHAHASQVTLALHKEESEVVLEVVDDGKGFDPAASFPGHMGLQTMHERLLPYNGTIHITSTKGKGTTLHVRLPLHYTAYSNRTINAMNFSACL